MISLECGLWTSVVLGLGNYLFQIFQDKPDYTAAFERTCFECIAVICLISVDYIIKTIKE